jgi:DNA-damage-inducible protein J
MENSLSTALNVFVRQSVRQGKIPFEISLNKPNAETRAAIREIEEMRSGLIPKQLMSVADFAREISISWKSIDFSFLSAYT